MQIHASVINHSRQHPEVVIRASEDGAAFRAIRLRALREHPEAYHSTVAEWDLPVAAYQERLRENRLIGAFDGGTLIGSVLIARTGRTGAMRRHKCEFWCVYLAPEFRGGGIAARMLHAAVQEARLLGYEAIVLTVNAENEPARRLYERCGFIAYGVERHAIRLAEGRYGDDVLMEMRLT